MPEEVKVDSSNDQSVLDRISHLPVMATALDQLNTLYTKAKENRLVEATATATEAGLGLAYNIAKPVAGKFEKQIDFLNKTACTQLDKLEETFPIITKPTEQVVKATLDYGHQIVDPVVSKVASVRDYGADKVAGVKEHASKTLAYGGHVLNDATNFTVGMTVGTAAFGCQKVKEVVSATGSTVTSVKNFGIEKVCEIKQKVVEVVSNGADSLGNAKNCVIEKVSETSSQVGDVLKSSLDEKLVAYEAYLDYYLPPGEDEKSSESAEKTSMVHKVLLVSDKTRNRVNRKLLREIRSTCQKVDSLKESSITKLGNTKSYIFALPEKMTTGVSLANSANGAISKVAYEAMTAVSAIVAAANGAKDRVGSIYNGVNLSEDFEKLMASGKEFGLKFVHDMSDKSEKIVSYAIHLPKDKFEAAKDKVVFLWTEINRPEEDILKEVIEDESANHSPDACTLERKLIATSRHLLQKTKEVATPVLGFVRVSKTCIDDVVDHVVNNLHELSPEKVIDTSFLQVSIVKPDLSKIVSGTYSASVEIFKKMNGLLCDTIFDGISTKNLDAAAARAMGEGTSSGEESSRQSPVLIIGNHEEIRNIDDVTTEEEEDDEDDDNNKQERKDDDEGEDEDNDIIEASTNDI